MALTSTERSRKMRRHAKGDHAMCDPSRCGTLGRQATAAASVGLPPDAAGLSALAAALAAEAPTAAPAHRMLLLLAQRMAARLDRLDDYLTGRADVWMRLHARNEDGSTVEVVLDAAVAEARQYDLALRQVLADLIKLAPAKPAAPGVSRRDELASRRAQRLADAAGS